MIKNQLVQMLEDARHLQTTYYSQEESLMHRLATGCMMNISQAMDLSWKIPELNPKSCRARFMGLVDGLHYILSMLTQIEKDSSVIEKAVLSRRIMIEHLHSELPELEELIASDKKIAVIDIDNVLYPYDEVWNHFVNFSEQAGIPLTDSKHLYRLSGLKASIPPKPMSLELLRVLQCMDMEIVLLSAREVDLYPESYADTLTFLHNFQIPHNFLLFKHEKRGGKILRKLFDNCHVFIDDNINQIKATKEYSIKHRVWLNLDRSSEESDGSFIECSSLHDVICFIDSLKK